MARYHVLDDEGAVINTIIADQDFMEAIHPGHYALVEEGERPPLTLELTKLDFRGRFTPAEQKIIDNFSIAEFAGSNAKITALTADQRADVRTAIATYRDATTIVLSDPLTIQFVTFLGALGLLDDDTRAAAILTP